MVKESQKGVQNPSPKSYMDYQQAGEDVKKQKSSVVTGKVSLEELDSLPFTLNDLKKVIPVRCFEKNLLISLYYMARDWLVVYILYYLSDSFFSLGFVGKFIWWNITGFFGWCLFVVGHDCGHGSFSNYPLLNDILGHLNHAPLCVPFHGWRISHRSHHQYHNDVDNDHSWRPLNKTGYEYSGIIPTFLFRYTPLLLFLYPVYLTRESRDAGFSGNHFNPQSPMFKKSEKLGGAISSFAVLAWISFLIYYFPANVLLNKYLGPYLVFIAWLSLVTYMQHTDSNVVYFRGDGWDYLKGAISTVDRTYKHLIDPFNLGYGTILDDIHHNISDAHVIHHLFFTQIPHYRLKEATKAVLPVLGKYYRFDSTPIPVAFVKSIYECHYVDDEGTMLTYNGYEKAKGLMGLFPREIPKEKQVKQHLRDH